MFRRLLVAGILTVASVTAAAQERTTLRLATYVNKVDVRYSSLQHFATQVRDKTQGRVEVQIFDSNTLHPFDKPIDSVLGGVSDISPLTGAGIDKRLPCAQLTNFMPLNVDWNRIVDLDQAYSEILNEEYAKLGLKIVMAQNANYDQEWFFRTPPAKLDELNGKMIRSVGPVVTHVIRQFGGNPVFISPSETYQSAERGVVDAVNMGVATFSSWNLWTVMPHMVRANMFFAIVTYTMNKAKFDKLRPEDQKAILEAGIETERWLVPRYEAWINEKVGAAVMKAGGSAVTLPKAERLRLVERSAKGWNDQLATACGPLAPRLRAVFETYKG